MAKGSTTTQARAAHRLPVPDIFITALCPPIDSTELQHVDHDLQRSV